jgi:hypothetical protein
VKPWEQVWNALYLFGGCFIVAGLALNRRGDVHLARIGISGYSIELSGLIFLGTALIANLIAGVAIAGFTVAATTYVALILACILRGWALIANRKFAVPVEVPGGGQDS